MSTVLVVDDDVTFLNSIHKMLRQKGYSVLRAVDGREAVKVLEDYRERIDLAIIDLCLPGLNGFEIIGAVARRPHKLKMIATTSVFKDSQLEVAGTLGAHALIRKPPAGEPLPESEWLQTVRKLIGTAAQAKMAHAASDNQQETPEH